MRFQCLAQAADVHVDGAFLDVDAAAPDVVEQLGAAVNALGMGHEEVQQAVLGGPDRHRRAGGEHAVRGAVDAQAADGDAGPAPVHIGPTEYRLLHFFMTHPERVYTRSQLLDHVWGGSVYVEERTVDVHIRRLRKTLEPHRLDPMVQTVRGAGYRFSAAA